MWQGQSQQGRQSTAAAAVNNGDRSTNPAPTHHPPPSQHPAITQPTPSQCPAITRPTTDKHQPMATVKTGSEECNLRSQLHVMLMLHALLMLHEMLMLHVLFRIVSGSLSTALLTFLTGRESRDGVGVGMAQASSGWHRG